MTSTHATRPTSVPRDSLRGAGRFGARVVLMSAGLLVAAIPFTILGVVVHTEGSTANRLDLGVAGDLHSFVARSAGLQRFLELVSNVFQPNTFRVALALGAVAVVRRNRRLALWIAVTVAGEAALDVTLKAAFGRARPTFTDPFVHATGGSFPSGHALGSFVGCAVAVMLLLPLVSRAARPAIIAVAAAIVALVGFSRVGLGAHYVTDVLGGWLLGFAWVCVTTAAFQSWRETAGLRRSHPSAEGIEPELPAETPASSA